MFKNLVLIILLLIFNVHSHSQTKKLQEVDLNSPKFKVEHVENYVKKWSKGGIITWTSNIDKDELEIVREVLTILIDKNYDRLGLVKTNIQNDEPVKFYLVGKKIGRLDNELLTDLDKNGGEDILEFIYEKYKQNILQEPTINSKEYENMSFDEQNKVVLEHAYLKRDWSKFKMVQSYVRVKILDNKLEELRSEKKMLDQTILDSKNASSSIRTLVVMNPQLKEVLRYYGFEEPRQFTKSNLEIIVRQIEKALSK